MLFIKVKTTDQNTTIINCKNITSIEAIPEDETLTKIYVNGQEPIVVDHPIYHFSMRLLGELDDLTVINQAP